MRKIDRIADFDETGNGKWKMMFPFSPYGIARNNVHVKKPDFVPPLMQNKYFPPGLLCACLLLGVHGGANAQAIGPLPAAMSGQQQAMTALREELFAARAKISNAAATLNQVEMTGPRINAIAETLAGLKITGPEKIKNFRSRLKEGVDKKDAQIKADHARVSTRLAQEQSDVEAAWTRDHPRKQKYFQSLVEQGPLTKSMEKDLAKTKQNLAAIESEKDLVIEELKTGQFCSKCMRSKHEIEKGSETFLEHLQHVGGYAVMAPAEIKKREAAFDVRIHAARQEQNDLEARIRDTAAKYEKEVAGSRKELADMELAYASRSSRNKTEKADADQQLTKKTAALAEEKKSLEADILARERELNNKIQALGTEISDRQAAFNAQRTALTSTLATLKAQEAMLAAKVDAASSKYATAYKKIRDDSYRSTVLQDTAKRRDAQQSRANWEASEHDFTVAQARHARRLLDNVPVAASPDAIAAKKAKAQQDQQAYQRIEASPEPLQQPDPAPRSGALTARAAQFMRSLPDDVQEKIQKNIETFSSPTNTARAVIRHSIASFEASVGNALLNKIQGKGSSLAEELAGAIEGAKPDLADTVKANIMPTIEDVAIDMAVSARSIEEQREFSVQERTTERGFARTRLFGANLKKHFNGLLRTFDETLDNATTLLGSSE